MWGSRAIHPASPPVALPSPPAQQIIMAPLFLSATWSITLLSGVVVFFRPHFSSRLSVAPKDVLPPRAGGGVDGAGVGGGNGGGEEET